MNNHMVNLREGIAYGDSSIRAPGSWTATSVSLTVSPPSFPSSRLQLHAAQQKQVNPQHSHEMPIHRGILEQAAAKRGMAGHQTPSQIHQSKDAHQNVQQVQEGQQIKER